MERPSTNNSRWVSIKVRSINIHGAFTLNQQPKISNFRAAKNFWPYCVLYVASSVSSVSYIYFTLQLRMSQILQSLITIWDLMQLLISWTILEWIQKDNNSNIKMVKTEISTILHRPCEFWVQNKKNLTIMALYFFKIKFLKWLR